MFTVGSLFAGIGGFDLGLERVGFTTEWFVENDPYCQRVLAKNWPDVKCYGDIREVKNLPYVDVLCGGFPCQDISNAGHKKGIDGEKSSLWDSFAHIIGEVRPRYVIVENVSALRTRGLDRVLGDLCALRYDAEWACIRASEVGALHKRDRFWLVAYPNGEQVREQQVAREGEETPFPSLDGIEQSLAYASGVRPRQVQQRATIDSERWGDEVATSREVVADAVGVGQPRRCRIFEPSRWSESQDSRKELGRVWEFEPNVGRVAHGVPSRMDRLKCLGNSLVPQIVTWIGQGIVEYENSK